MSRSRAAAIAAAVGFVVAGLPATAVAAPPTIVNSGSASNWLETFSSVDDGSGNVTTVTLLVRHDPGRRITSLAIDQNHDGVDDTAGGGTVVAVTPQFYGSGATNFLETSVVTYSFNHARPAGFSCTPPISGTRRLDRPVRFRAIDDTGARAGNSVSATMRFVEDSQCGTIQDFPRMYGQSQNATNVIPDATVQYQFRCDDVDGAGSSDDECNRYRWRWRRLHDGATSAVSGNISTGGDNDLQTLNVSFPERGHYVVEAQLGNENGDYPDSGAPLGGWWRIGNARVNEPSNEGPTVALTFAGPGLFNGPTPSVNQGAALNALATVGDAGIGTPEVIEWDAANDGTFERRESSQPQTSGAAVLYPALTPGERTQSVTTATHGLKTVGARVLDNGALDAADAQRRTSSTATRQYRVNAIPTAANVPTSTSEDTPKTITLSGADADDQPAALTYEVVGTPAGGSVTIAGNQATFTPSAGFTGQASFLYRVHDRGTTTDQAWSYSSPATVTIDVTAVDDPPVASDISVTTNEDTQLPIELVATDPDSPLTYSAGQPVNGTVTCTGADCVYTPGPNFSGTDQFTYTATGGSQSDQGTVTITVTPVNDAPVAADASVETDEDTEVTFGLPVSDVDDGTPAITVTGQPNHGTVTCGATCSYTPPHNFNGTDTFQYTATDAAGASDTGTITITVVPVNDAPVAGSQTVTTDEDVPIDIQLGATDVDGDGLTYAVANGPAHGTVTCTGADCVYTPGPNFSGTDQFTYTATDGELTSAAATIEIDVRPVNDPPVANDGVVETDEDTEVTFGLPVSDVDDGTPAITVTGQPNHGTVTCGATCSYTPPHNFNGTDTFQYTATDAAGASDTGTITITVVPVNDAPVAEDTSATTDEDTPVDVTIPATDVDGDDLTYTVVEGPQHGTVTCAGAVCTYTPDANYSGADAFKVRVGDGEAGDDSVVTVTINPVNDPPVAADATIETDEDTEVTFGVPASDVDDATLDITVTDPPDHGTVACAATCSYTPQQDFDGTDTFHYTATDSAGANDTGTITITVVPVNDAPVAGSQTVTTDEDTPLDIQLGATDVDGDGLTYAVADGPAHGTVQCSDAGACTYSPAADIHGDDAFTFTATDGELTSATATIEIDVRPINDPPVAEDTSATTDEDTPVDVTIPATDLDGDSLEATAAGASNGSVTCTGLVCTYTPDANFHGTDGFTATISDPDGAQDTSAVSVTVREVNDRPVADDLAIFLDEDGFAQFALGGSDVDGDQLTFAVKPGSGPAHGAVTCEDGTCLYAPEHDFHGADGFTFVADDGRGGTAEGNVSLTIRPVNDAPTAPDQEAEVDEDGELIVELQGTDVDGDVLTYESAGEPSHGAVSCTPAGRCTYQPAADFFGADSFTYRADDGHGGTATGTVLITVKPINDAPVASDLSVVTEEDTPVDIGLVGEDVDDTVLHYVAEAPGHGTLSCAEALCTYTPDADYFGPDSFTYTVRDAAGATDTATVTIDVAEIKHETAIEVGPVVKTKLPLKISILYKARLTRKSDGAAVSGREVTFLTGGQRACSAFTGPDGWAACGWTVSNLLGVLLDGGYDAVFAGDEDYTPVSGHGTIIG